ncbi:nicotinate-nicotinamide nucleotide adenylyltransferase [Vibrio algivorus]|uniref:nicotinate-nucleotide adenylyltransferase n=1 Tax=Vibrio algivorus TaxID=1667024 RepID=A0A557P8S4_9VIBR|nr:nicotinate-nicotinamide nucleotide adenylyltransferase [Vibrio algivorus]TVO37054.1 nicotinate-nicotinamide nucleotide adenylyltransferase [Vibrio algivorus]GLT14539.1 nicotinate-nicotinamide nucleotide adenylyltransferase [Vibrio algivorus]
MNIAIFGSAFNPPSRGHQSVLERLKHYDLVLLVPSIAHAWGKDMLGYSTRCEMVEAFIQDVKLDNLQISNIEAEILQSNGEEQGQSVTTYAVMTALQEHYPQSQLTFVLGPDNFLNFGKFYKADEITSKWSILACPETLPVRSTQIRQRLANHQSIRDLTTPSVEEYVQEHKLYS